MQLIKLIWLICLAVLFFQDLKRRSVNNATLTLLLICGCISAIKHHELLVNLSLGGSLFAATALIFAVGNHFRRPCLGGGDVLFVAALGLMFGLGAWYIFFLAAVIGCFVWQFCWAWQIKSKREMPLVSYMCLATLPFLLLR